MSIRTYYSIIIIGESGPEPEIWSKNCRIEKFWNLGLSDISKIGTILRGSGPINKKSIFDYLPLREGGHDFRKVQNWYYPRDWNKYVNMCGYPSKIIIEEFKLHFVRVVSMLLSQ